METSRKDRVLLVLGEAKFESSQKKRLRVVSSRPDRPTLLRARLKSAPTQRGIGVSDLDSLGGGGL